MVCVLGQLGRMRKCGSTNLKNSPRRGSRIRARYTGFRNIQYPNMNCVDTKRARRIGKKMVNEREAWLRIDCALKDCPRGII